MVRTKFTPLRPSLACLNFAPVSCRPARVVKEEAARQARQVEQAVATEHASGALLSRPRWQDRVDLWSCTNQPTVKFEQVEVPDRDANSVACNTGKSPSEGDRVDGGSVSAQGDVKPWVGLVSAQAELNSPDELTTDARMRPASLNYAARSSRASDGGDVRGQSERATGAADPRRTLPGVMGNNKHDDDPPVAEPQPDLLLHRFGTPRYYEDTFRNLIHDDPAEVFERLERSRTNKTDNSYDTARQDFLRIYGKHRGNWHATSQLTDRGVDATKLHVSSDRKEYIGFLRIQPDGHRGERLVAPYMDIKLHLLIGKALLTYRKRQRTMTRGSHAHIAPKSSITIKCLSHDQAAVFVLKIRTNPHVDVNKAEKKNHF